MGTGSALYRIVLLAHIAAAIVGFGGLLAAGLVHARAFRSPAAAAGTLLAAGRSIVRVANNALYALLLLGVVLVSLSDGAIGFGATWISASFVVWLLVLGALHGLVRPSVAGLADRADALGPEVALRGDGTADGLAKRLALGEALVQVGMVVGLALMLWQPGN